MEGQESGSAGCGPEPPSFFSYLLSALTPHSCFQEWLLPAPNLPTSSHSRGAWAVKFHLCSLLCAASTPTPASSASTPPLLLSAYSRPPEVPEHRLASLRACAPGRPLLALSTISLLSAPRHPSEILTFCHSQLLTFLTGGGTLD